MNNFPNTLIGRRRGRITTRLARLEAMAAGGFALPGRDALVTRTPRGTFTRARNDGAGSGTSTNSQRPRWL